jgi:predicted RNase H-like nuclease (RuvC/YqgF family)
MDLQTPIHKLPSFVNQLSSHKGKLEREIANKKQEYNQVIKENEKYVDELQEFRAKKHLLPKLNDLQQLLNSKINTLDLAIKESSDLAKENYQLKAILAKDDILPYEFTEANKKLDLSGDNKPLDKKEIAAIVYELYYYPSDHINIIKTMRQRIKQQQHEFEINNQ